MTLPREAVRDRDTEGPLGGFPIRSMVAQVSLRVDVGCGTPDSRLFARVVNGGYRYSV